MKGFLNKVQNRVAGKGPSSPSPEGKAPSPTNNSYAPSAPAGPVDSSAANKGVETVPKADITIPKGKERR